MKPGRREALILGAAGVAAAAAGFLVGPILLRSMKAGGGAGSGEGGNAGGNAELRSASFVDLSGKRRTLDEWQGKILICNFWATWCAPCREEIPLLMAVREKYAPVGVEIVGIAIDNATKVGDFTASLKISYPILLAEANGLDLMRKLGNSAGGLPYTVVADRHGGVQHRKLGAFRQGDLDAILGPLTRT
jgi:thiol-disulfide isomerase/thioredoxin